MRRRLALALLLLPLGACPPSQPGDATDTAGTGTSAGATAGASTSGDMSSGTSTTTTTTTGDVTTTAPATATTADSTSTTGGTTGGTTGEASTTGTTGGASSTGGTTGGAVTFLCDGCLCDAGATYCRKVLAGLIEPQGDPPLCPVVPEDPLLSGCVAYPDACGDTPTCDCIPNLNNNCFCQEQMGTFTLTCPLP